MMWAQGSLSLAEAYFYTQPDSVVKKCVFENTGFAK
jgi:hypothetical protein